MGTVVQKLQDRGVEQTAIHHNLLHESPRILYVHIRGQGDLFGVSQRGDGYAGLQDPHQGWRIIGTDDSTIKLSSLVQTLRGAGHSVLAAYDGESAFELILQLPTIDLLITNTRLGSCAVPS